MKIKAILCLIAGVFLLANIAKVQTLPYGFEPWVSDSTVWVTPQDNSIANAVAEVPTGGTIILWPGSYDLTDISSAPSCGIHGVTPFSTIVTGAVGMTIQPGNPIRLSNLRIGKMTFRDSVFIQNCEIIDSLLFTGACYYEITDSYSNFSTTAALIADSTSTGIIRGCKFRSTAGSCFKASESAAITIYNSAFHSVGSYVAYYATDLSITKTIGSNFLNNADGSGAATFLDSAKLYSYGNNYFNETSASSNYGLVLLTGSNCVISNDGGSGMMAMKSEDDEAGVISLVGVSTFSKMNIYGGPNSDSCLTYLNTSKSSDLYFPGEIVFWKGSGNCLYGDYTIIHSEDRSGDPAVILESQAKFTLQGDSCSFALGDTISSKDRTIFELFAGGHLSFSSTATVDTIVHVGLLQADKLQLTPVSDCYMWGSCSANGDTAFVNRSDGTVSGMNYYWWAFRVQ